LGISLPKSNDFRLQGHASGQAPELESIMAAVKAQNSQMMQLLLRRKADVNAQELEIAGDS